MSPPVGQSMLSAAAGSTFSLTLASSKLLTASNILGRFPGYEHHHTGRSSVMDDCATYVDGARGMCGEAAITWAATVSSA